MMEYLLSALWIGIEMAAMMLFCGAFLPLRQRPHPAGKCLALWAVLSLLSFWPVTKPYFSVISYPLLYGLIQLLFQGKWYGQLLLEVLCAVFLLLMDALVGYGFCGLMGISVAELLQMRLVYSVVATMGKMIVLLCAWLTDRFRRSSTRKGLRGKWVLLSIAFPVLSILIISVNYYNNRNVSVDSVGVFAISMILMLANVGIVYLIGNLEKTTDAEQRAALLKQQMEYQKMSYAALENNYRTQRKSAHEFERHLQTLGDLMGEGAYDTALEYVQKLRNSRSRAAAIRTGHPVFDVILNQKYQLAQEYGIRVDWKVNDLSGVTIPTEELVVLLSNLLDNAIEACRRKDGEKEIVCKILKQDSLLLAIRNTSDPVELDHGWVAAKAENLEHGYGLPAIRQVLEALGAEYRFSYENDWFSFAADFPLERVMVRQAT